MSLLANTLQLYWVTFLAVAAPEPSFDQGTTPLDQEDVWLIILGCILAVIVAALICYFSASNKREQRESQPCDEVLEIRKDQLRWGAVFRVGTYGLERQAEAYNIVPDQPVTTVAVRLFSPGEKLAALSELKTMVHLGRHLNVLNLLGAQTTDLKRLRLVFEYSKYGNLRHYLFSHRSDFVDELSVTTEVVKSMQDVPNIGAEPGCSTSDLFRYGFQVALGMKFLASRNVVHGNLAARNVLLTDDNIVKISDFGIAEIVQVQTKASFINCMRQFAEMCTWEREEPAYLPIKWMPLEVIGTLKFTKESDVWMYGNLVWELFSLAEDLYADVPVTDLREKLKAGYRMEKPRYATNEIYSVMTDCWQRQPLRRPNFGQLVQRLSSMLNDADCQMYIDMNKKHQAASRTQQNKSHCCDCPALNTRRSRTLFENGNIDNLLPFDSFVEQAKYLPYDNIFEVSKAQLRMGKVIGMGVFGVVMKAEAYGIVPEEPVTNVAVKMLHGNRKNQATMDALASEMKIMVHLGRHLNIVNLLGAHTADLKNMFLVLEYCKYGNLHNYLSELQSDFVEAMCINTGVVQAAQDDRAKAERDCRTSDLFLFAFQVAQGMEFLTRRNVLHGDLAARNVLLSDDKVVKICDFGLSKILLHDQRKRQNKGSVFLPVKWMAIEAVQEGKLSKESDVWSFGIFTWELFSLAESPYAEVHGEDLQEKLKAGYRMGKPCYANDEIYKVMTDCWQEQPLLRPDFTALVKTLGSMIDDADRQMYAEKNKKYEAINRIRHQEPDYYDHLQMFTASYYNILPDPAAYANIRLPAETRRKGPGAAEEETRV